MASSPPWHPLLSSKPKTRDFHRVNPIRIRQVATIRALRRSDFDGFAKRVASAELWHDAWRRANDGVEQFVYDTRKNAERIDRRYAVSRRLSAVAQSAADRAREYRKQLSDFADTPLGGGIATLFFLWFALSGWLFRTLIFATWVLSLAGPLLVGVVANNLVIKRKCPACKRPFVGYKNQTVGCASCGNVVWQPQDDFFSRGGKGGKSSSSKSRPDIIDVEFEEK
ncbi:hypothetical protein OROGR_016116 [Orobanche gracilis]